MNRVSRTLILVLAVAAAVAIAPATVSAKTVWLCKPGQKSNPCTPGLSTTVFSPAGKKVGVTKPKPAHPPRFDCFYVYPTVSDQTTPLASKRIDPEERSIALYQTARYSQYCRVYAPMYRQVTLSALLGGGRPTTQPSVPYNDVREAWRTYLRKYNKGRGVVLIGHSQGSFVLRQLVTKEIDPKPAARRKLISAVLLGGNVTVKKGKDVGGDFKHVRACRAPKQLGCVVAFSTFEDPAPAGSLFGRTSAAGLEVLCTNPAALGGGSAKLTSIYPSAPFAPGTIIATAIKILGITQPTPPTTWAQLAGAYSGRCSSAGGADVLQITPRKGAPKFTASPDPTWGLHLVDANIALGNLVDLVHTQGTAYLKKHGG